MPRQLPHPLVLRNAVPEDHPGIIAVLKPWWGGRDLTWMLPRLFLNHFGNSSFIIENEKALVAFLIGLFSQSRPNEGYIHFAGVHPDYRNRGIGAYLYGRFFQYCRDNGRHIVRSCTSPVNTGSVKFHQKIGFDLAAGDAEMEGVPVTLDYNRPGDPKVCFRIEI